MRNVRFYHRETGIFHPNVLVASDDAAVALNTPPDHVAIDNPGDGSAYDHLSQRVDIATGSVVDHKPEQSEAAEEVQRLKAARHARVRVSALLLQQHHLVRRLILNQSDAAARAALEAIDAEMQVLMG